MAQAPVGAAGALPRASVRRRYQKPTPMLPANRAERVRVPGSGTPAAAVTVISSDIAYIEYEVEREGASNTEAQPLAVAPARPTAGNRVLAMSWRVVELYSL